MTLLIAWVAFPIVLLALCAGWGLAIEVACRRRLPGALVPAVGLAAVIVVAGFATALDATAELALPIALAGALLGYAAAARTTRRTSGFATAAAAPSLRAVTVAARSLWPVAVAAGVFAVYAAPIVLSGEATFAGYIRLDDTATWMALTDRVMEHGRSLDGLAGSTYEATLAFNLADGYPVGVFLPLGIVANAIGLDVAWAIQPYMGVLAAILGLALWNIATPLIGSPRLRAAVAFVGAQPALLYGYYLWGGIKEIAAAALIAAAAALVVWASRQGWQVRALAPLAVVCGALVGVLSVGGLIWVAPLLLGGLALACASRGVSGSLRAAAAFTAVVAVASVPVLAAGGALPPTSAPLDSAAARGNLFAPLRIEQIAGIWPVGDFRVEPADRPVILVLIAVAIAAAAAGLWIAARRRAWGPLLYVGGLLVAGLAIWSQGSPWVDAKALATASSAIPFAAGILAAIAIAAGRRIAGGAVLALVAGGILWSNALAYHEVNLAPRGQLAELERIGERIAGEGPTLMTEYQPYGARHFLREGDPEAVSELRRRLIPLLDGTTVEKGDTADTDELAFPDLLDYRTLVLRRSPVTSRPPSPYRLTWRGEHYEVWQQAPRQARRVVARLPLGSDSNPAGTPDCGRLMRLAGQSPRARLIAARSPQVVRSALPAATDVLELDVAVPAGGRWGVWVGGSVRDRIDAWVGERRAGFARHFLNNRGFYVPLGEVEVRRGTHQVRLRRSGADLHPGSGGREQPLGPLVLSRAVREGGSLRRVPAARARALCGRPWDWIEAVRRPPGEAGSP